MKDFFKNFTGHFLPGKDNAYRPHLLRKQWLLFFLTIVLTAEGIYVAALLTEESARNFLSAVLPGEVIALTNVERTQLGDQPLAEASLLATAAQNKANDMANQGYFSHVGPDGKQPWQWIAEAGYPYRYAGENLAVRFDNSSDVVNAWMASPTHRANIIKPVYEEIGIGVAQGLYEGVSATFVVQYFGTPTRSAVAAIPAETPSTPSTPTPNASSVAGAEVEGESTVAPVASATPAQASAPLPVSQLQSEMQTSAREAAQTFVRASEASQSSINWIIGGIALFLVALIGLAVFVHIEIQPTEMVMGGVFVGAVALSLFMLNSSITGTGASGGGAQSASVLNAVPTHTIYIGSEAASFEPAP